MKKVIALLLALSALLSLAACGGESTVAGESASVSEFTQNSLEQQEQVKEENNITTPADLPFDASRKSTANSDERYAHLEFAQSLSPTDWQPYNMQDAAKAFGKLMVYEFLFDRVGASEYAPRIGKSWEKEDDTHYIVEIYDDVKDSEGNPVKASDVVFSYDLNAGSGYADKFDLYQSAEALNDTTVRFTLNGPITALDGFNYLFANVAIVAEKAYDEMGFSKKPIGTGPYVLTEFVTDSYCVFEVNENYWATGAERSELAKQNVQSVRINFVTDASMRMIMLESGSSICNPYLTATDVNSFLKGGEFEGQFNLTTISSSQSVTMLANCSPESILSDVNMRLACWYAIDTTALVTALGSNAYTAYIVEAAPCIGDYQAEWNDIESYQTEFSIEKSKEYQEKAGYNGEAVKILSGTFPLKKNISQIVSEMLRQAGINSEIEVVEFVVQDEKVHTPGAWDLYSDSQMDNDYTINRLNNLYSISAPQAENGVTKSYIDDPTLQELLNSCNTLDNYAPEKAGEVLQYILDQAYGYATAYQTSYTAWNKDVAKIVCPYGQDTTPRFNCCDYYLD